MEDKSRVLSKTTKRNRRFGGGWSPWIEGGDVEIEIKNLRNPVQRVSQVGDVVEVYEGKTER